MILPLLGERAGVRETATLANQTFTEKGQSLLPRAGHGEHPDTFRLFTLSNRHFFRFIRAAAATLVVKRVSHN